VPSRPSQPHVVPLSGDALDAAWKEQELAGRSTRSALLRLAEEYGITLIQRSEPESA